MVVNQRKSSFMNCSEFFNPRTKSVFPELQKDTLSSNSNRRKPSLLFSCHQSPSLFLRKFVSRKDSGKPHECPRLSQLVQQGHTFKRVPDKIIITTHLGTSYQQIGFWITLLNVTTEDSVYEVR